jgi:hypothetical protein
VTIATEDQVEALLDGVDMPTATFTELAGIVDPLIDTALGRPAEGGTERTETFTLGTWARRDYLKLSRWPVSAVASITEDGEALTVDETFRVDLDAGIVYRLYDADGVLIPWLAGKVLAVTYTPATVPVAASIAAQAIARAYKTAQPTTAGGKPAVMAGLRQLTIGRWSATAETSAESTAAAVHLTDRELAVLKAHKDRSP